MRLQQEIVLGIGGSRALDKIGPHAHDPAHQRGPRRVRVAREDPPARPGGAASPSPRRARSRRPATSSRRTRPCRRGSTSSRRTCSGSTSADTSTSSASRSTSSSTSAARSASETRELFSMAVLAMRLSTHQNAVSQLHAERLAAALARRDAGPAAVGDPDPADHERRPRADLDGARDRRDGRGARTPRASTAASSGRRTRRFARGSSRRAARSSSRSGAAPGARDEEIARGGDAPSTREALTIGFARRFATYKRATLLFREPKRLEYLLHQIGRPVQILFAGKAHPRDEPGKEFLRDRRAAPPSGRSSGAASSSWTTTTWGSRARSSPAATSG